MVPPDVYQAGANYDNRRPLNTKLVRVKGSQSTGKAPVRRGFCNEGVPAAKPDFSISKSPRRVDTHHNNHKQAHPKNHSLSAVHRFSNLGAPIPFPGCKATKTAAALTKLSLSAISSDSITGICRPNSFEMTAMGLPSQAKKIGNLRNLVNIP